MDNKKGVSKVLIVFIILLLIALIVGGVFLTMYLMKKDKEGKANVVLYEEYTEGKTFVGDEDTYFGEHLEPLADGLKEARNDELGIRYGYLNYMDIPEAEETEDGTYVSTSEAPDKSTTVVLRVGKIDESQSGIDHVEKQKEALTQELIKAETIVEEVKDEDGNIIKREIAPEKVSDIAVSYSILASQLAVRFTYTENDLKCTRLLTIKDNQVYSITYKATEEEYRSYEEENVFNSFEFISRMSDTEKTAMNTITINEKEYTLPIKVTNIDGISMDQKYSTQTIEPNYVTVVSLYESQSPKYSAYVYNARESMTEIRKGYITAISTDVNRGGNVKIYKGIEIGTSYSKVTELLGSPTTSHYTDGDSILVHIYEIGDAVIQLKFRNDDLSKPKDGNAKVVSILLRVVK